MEDVKHQFQEGLKKFFLRKEESSANFMALDRMKSDINKMAFTHGTQPTKENFFRQ